MDKLQPVAPPLDALSLEYHRLSDLLRRLWSENPKAHDIDGIQLSMTRYRYNAPVTVNERTGLLVAGHGRIISLGGLKESGNEPPGHVGKLDDGDWTVPVVRGCSFATDAEVEEYVVSDNVLTMARGFDENRLAPMIKNMIDRRVPLVELGWRQSQITSALRRMRRNAGEPETPEASEELRRKWDTAPGQVWRIASETVPGSHHVVVCGDSREPSVLDALMAGARATWLWSDPPYGVGYEGGMRRRKKIDADGDVEAARAVVGAAFKNVDRYLDNAPLYVACMPGRSAIALGLVFMEQQWHLHQTLCWAKNNIALGRSDYRGQFELVHYGWKGEHRWYGGRDKSTLQAHDRPAKAEMHPTEKPTSLIISHLDNSTLQGEVGIDPFAGSGSTLIAAERTGRLCRAVELTPEYTAVIIERAQLCGLEPTRSI